MNKTYIAAAIAVVAGIVISFTVFGGGGGQLLNVNEVSSDPAAFQGKITVAGVAVGVSKQDPSIFGIVDLKELQCNNANCNKVIIPVKYSGAIPKIGDEVRVSGSFVAQGGGHYFAGEKVKVVKHHPIGGQS